MPNLSPAGTQLVQELAQRHGLSTNAVTHMLIAVHNGNGSMAQFSHPEFGGSGQWMRGGMTMVSDLFNHQLKSRVDNLCSDIANELGNHQRTPFSGSFQSQSQNGMHSQSQAAGAMGSSNSLFVPDPAYNWWPSELGTPSALGSQNNVRYAYFAQSHRLAVTTGGEVWVYDTLDHQIGGFSQQQGIGGSITFTSQFGTVNLSTLPVVSRDGVKQQPTPQSSAAPAHAVYVPQAPSDPTPPPFVGQSIPMETAPSVAATGQTEKEVKSQDILDTLDRLGELLKKGYITEAEFVAKKVDLLNRL